MKNKVLLIGNEFDHNLETSYLRAFKHLNYESKIFNIVNLRNKIQNFLDHEKIYKYLNSSQLRKFISVKYNKKILKYILQYKPTICFFFNLNFISHETISILKKNGILTISFLPDNHFEDFGFKRVEILQSLKYINYNFLWGRNFLKFSNMKNIFFLNFGWDSLLKKKFSNNSIKRITFIGNYDKYRFKFISNIKERKFLRVWGSPCWKNLSSSLGGNIYQNNSLSYNNYIKISKSSAINLNILRLQNISAGGLNMRSFELGGEKCFYLQNTSPETENFYGNISHKILFKDFDDMNEKIFFFLNNKNERRNILTKIFKKINSDHKYIDRVKYILKIIK